VSREDVVVSKKNIFSVNADKSFCTVLYYTVLYCEWDKGRQVSTYHSVVVRGYEVQRMIRDRHDKNDFLLLLATVDLVVRSVDNKNVSYYN